MLSILFSGVMRVRVRVRGFCFDMVQAHLLFIQIAYQH